MQDVTAVRGHYLVTLTQTECWPQRNASQLCWSDQQVFTFLPPVVIDDLSIARIWWCAVAVPTTTAESVTATMRGGKWKRQSYEKNRGKNERRREKQIQSGPHINRLNIASDNSKYSTQVKWTSIKVVVLCFLEHRCPGYNKMTIKKLNVQVWKDMCMEAWPKLWDKNSWHSKYCH